MSLQTPEAGQSVNGSEAAAFEAQQQQRHAEAAEQQAMVEFVAALKPGIDEKLAEFRRNKTTTPLFISTGDHPFDEALRAEVYADAGVDQTRERVTNKEINLRLTPEAGAIIQTHLSGIDEAIDLGEEFLERPELHGVMVYEYPMEDGFMREVKFETHTSVEGQDVPETREHTMYFAAAQSTFKRA